MIRIFSKSYCSYCKKAIALAEKYGIAPEIIQLDSIPNGQSIHNELIKETNQKTVPVIFIHDQFIGGYSDFLMLHQNNQLASFLTNENC